MSDNQSNPIKGWVKASERLPKMETPVYFKISGAMGLGNFYEDDGCYMLYVQRNGAHDEYAKPFSSPVNKDVEWLDETPIQSGEERLFTLKEALDIWEDAMSYNSGYMGSIASYEYNKQQYFKEKFNLELK